MSSENAKPDQIQASVAAALSRLRGDLSPAATPQQPGGEPPRAANDLRADPFFKSIQSTQPQPAMPGQPSAPRGPIPMTPFTRMQAPQEPVPDDSASEATEPLVTEDAEPMPTMPEPTSSAPMSSGPTSSDPASEPTPMLAPPLATPEPAPAAQPARQSVVERQSAQGGALSRFMRPEAKEAGPDPVQRDLLAGLPPPPISEPLTTDTETSAPRRRRRNRMILAGALGVVVVAVGAWLWSGGESDTEVPVITAETTPEKVAPTEPGGVDVPNQNIQILNGETAQPQEETVMPAPEQPVAPPQATAEAASEAPVIEEPATTGAATADASTAPAAPTTEAPAVDAPPAPEVPLANVPLPAQTESATDATAAPEAPATAAPAETATAAPSEQPAQKPAQTQAPATQAPATQAPATQAPAPEPAATQQASVAPSATGNARIQLAAVKSESAAKTEWAKMQKAHPDLLGALTLTVQKVDKGASGVFYRLQAGPLADKNAAKQLCASLKAQNQDCIVASK